MESDSLKIDSESLKMANKTSRDKPKGMFHSVKQFFKQSVNENMKKAGCSKNHPLRLLE